MYRELIDRWGLDAPYVYETGISEVDESHTLYYTICFVFKL